MRIFNDNVNLKNKKDYLWKKLSVYIYYEYLKVKELEWDIIRILWK